MKQDIDTLCRVLGNSTSPFHTVKEAIEQFSLAGFQELIWEEDWKVEKGKGYFLRVYGSSLIAFIIGENWEAKDMLRIEAAHADFPCFKIKPLPEKIGRYAVLNVEVYGGPIFNTWLDRPLSIAGRVALRGKEAFVPEIRLLDMEEPVCIIPNLAIHMNRKINEGIELNRQVDLLPLAGIKERGDWFLKEIADRLEVRQEEILDYELNLYNVDKPTVFGFQKEMLTSPRIDNITSVQACVSGLIHSGKEKGIHVVALFDNEEVGSKTKQGGDSMLLSYILERLYLALGKGRAEYLSAIAGGMMLSVDVAHAIHPNHPEKCDITNQIYLNDGVALKQSGTQRYATDCEATAIIEQLCYENQIAYKKFANRSDIPGGSTLGSLQSSILPMRTVDMGIPILAMHSARETMGVTDYKSLCKLMEVFFFDK